MKLLRNIVAAPFILVSAVIIGVGMVVGAVGLWIDGSDK